MEPLDSARGGERASLEPKRKLSPERVRLPQLIARRADKVLPYIKKRKGSPPAKRKMMLRVSADGPRLNEDLEQPSVHSSRPLTGVKPIEEKEQQKSKKMKPPMIFANAFGIYEIRAKNHSRQHPPAALPR